MRVLTSTKSKNIDDGTGTEVKWTSTLAIIKVMLKNYGCRVKKFYDQDDICWFFFLISRPQLIMSELRRCLKELLSWNDIWLIVSMLDVSPHEEFLCEFL